MKINYEALRAQKNILYMMIQDWMESGVRSKIDSALEAEGLIGLIDALQDKAVKEGLDESLVFGIICHATGVELSEGWNIADDGIYFGSDKDAFDYVLEHYDLSLQQAIDDGIILWSQF